MDLYTAIELPRAGVKTDFVNPSDIEKAELLTFIKRLESINIVVSNLEGWRVCTSDCKEA